MAPAADWLSRTIGAVGLLLGDSERPWVDAIRAELYATDSIREQLRLAASGLRGLGAIALEGHMRRWVQSAPALITALALGVVTGCVDLLSDTRWALRLMLPASCLIASVIAPRAASVAGLLVGVGLPFVATVSGFRGPYEFDPADVWLPLIPAILFTSSLAWLRSRIWYRWRH